MDGASEADLETRFVQKWFTRECLQETPEPREEVRGQGRRSSKGVISQVSPCGAGGGDGLWVTPCQQTLVKDECTPRSGQGLQFPGTFSSPGHRGVWQPGQM